MKTLVLGLGNPILTDDGVGVRVAEAVRQALPPEAPVEVSEAGLGGLTLMERMVGYERVILIDALQAPQAQPGRIRRLTLADLEASHPTQHATSAHDTSLVTALAVGRRMGLPLPRQVVICAIEVENTVDFSDQPTPAVAAAIPGAAAAVLQVLTEMEEPHDFA
jgi:hydrogenase maturation protease